MGRVTAREYEQRFRELEELRIQLSRISAAFLPADVRAQVEALRESTDAAKRVAREELSAAEDREMELPFCIESGDRVDTCGCGVCV